MKRGLLTVALTLMSSAALAGGYASGTIGAGIIAGGFAGQSSGNDPVVLNRLGIAQ